MPSASPSPREQAIERLELDPLRHIVGLKMLAQVGDAADVVLREDDAGWAALIRFAASEVEYDTRRYGPEALIAVLEGTSDALQLGMLDELNALGRLDARHAPHELVLKTHNRPVVQRAREQLGARPAAAFLSLTSSDAHGLFPRPPVTNAATDCETSTRLTAALRAVFESNGYAASELARHFGAGARWFAIERAGEVEAACFVYPNFGPVWEVAGVHTRPTERRRGLASRVVAAAIGHLLRAGALPRYQTSAENAASLALAQGLGLREFLRIEHLKIERRRAQ